MVVEQWFVVNQIVTGRLPSTLEIRIKTAFHNIYSIIWVTAEITLSLIAVDRYLALFYPLLPFTWFRKPIMVIPCTWLLSCLSCVFKFYAILWWDSRVWLSPYLTSFFTLFYFIPLALITAVYV